MRSPPQAPSAKPRQAEAQIRRETDVPPVRALGPRPKRADPRFPPLSQGHHAGLLSDASFRPAACIARVAADWRQEIPRRRNILLTAGWPTPSRHAISATDSCRSSYHSRSWSVDMIAPSQSKTSWPLSMRSTSRLSSFWSTVIPAAFASSSSCWTPRSTASSVYACASR